MWVMHNTWCHPILTQGKLFAVHTWTYLSCITLILVHVSSGIRRVISHFRRQEEPMNQQIQLTLTCSTLLSHLHKSSISHKPAHQKSTCDELENPPTTDQDLKINSCMRKLKDWRTFQEAKKAWLAFSISILPLSLMAFGLWSWALFIWYLSWPAFKLACCPTNLCIGFWVCSQAFILPSSIFSQEFVSGVNHTGDRH